MKKRNPFHKRFFSAAEYQTKLVFHTGFWRMPVELFGAI